MVAAPPSKALERPVRLAVLLSGSGTTLQNLLDEIAAGRLDAEVAVVVASRADAFGLERARRAGIAVRTVARKQFTDSKAFNDALHAALADFRVDLVVLAGFLSLFEPRQFAMRVLNIHPALIPAFCGPGYYGAKVHRAVIEAGVKVSGCTVHFADAEYDHGPIIVQATVPVLDDDTPETLASRVHLAENHAYPEAIRLWAQGRLRVEGQRVRVLPAAQGVDDPT